MVVVSVPWSVVGCSLDQSARFGPSSAARWVNSPVLGRRRPLVGSTALFWTVVGHSLGQQPCFGPSSAARWINPLVLVRRRPLVGPIEPYKLHPALFTLFSNCIFISSTGYCLYCIVKIIIFKSMSRPRAFLYQVTMFIHKS
ncbi:hypothetical protein BN1048_00559 [Jeotgalicoccus saudimassiliensis]|uniref:Uncharacterized protein n=1 Tax=Jeotgalicoccus saudimassiliensis TaxID=1461582 RepID=A0A078M022_9STAP|nr:hypothetical protein BN1048_00559 [Jeotgalicoccus saudimassiliensis]